MATETIIFGDYELTSANAVVIGELDELNAAESDMTILDVVGVRGVKVLSDTFSQKVIPISGILKCSSERTSQVREFVTAMVKQGQPLSIANGEGTFVYDGCYVLNKDKMFEKTTFEGKAAIRFNLAILAPKGFARTVLLTTDTVASITSLPYEDTIIIGGDTNPEPVITLTLTDAATIEDIFFTNQTTNQQISVSGITFLDGDILVFDTEAKEVRVNAVPVSFEGVFPDFNVGENSWQLTAAGAANLAVEQGVYNDEELLYGNNHLSQSFQVSAGDMSQLALLLKRVDTSVFQLLDNFNDNSVDTAIWISRTGTYAEEGGELRVGKKGGSGSTGNVNTTGRSGIEGFEIAFSWVASGTEGPNVYAFVQSAGAGATTGRIEAASQHAVNKTLVRGTGALAGIGTYTFTGSSATLKVEQDGATLKVYVDGTPRLSGTYEIGGAPICGLEADAGSGTDFYMKANIVNEKTLADANGDITVELQTDTAGDPSGVAVTDATLTIAAADVGTAFSELIKAFAIEPTLAGATTYHAVVTQAGGDINNYYVLKKQNTDVLANGNLETSIDAGATWTQETGEDLYFKLWSTLPTGFDIDVAIAYFNSYYNVA